jgi:hypothetical protein
MYHHDTSARHTGLAARFRHAARAVRAFRVHAARAARAVRAVRVNAARVGRVASAERRTLGSRQPAMVPISGRPDPKVAILPAAGRRPGQLEAAALQ